MEPQASPVSPKDGWIPDVRREIVIYLMGFDPGETSAEDRIDAPWWDK